MEVHINWRGMHRALKEEWRVIKNAHAPIVSQELFDKVQDIFQYDPPN
ncbi:recombinase family protein [uncultured Anaerovibrio sp.]